MHIIIPPASAVRVCPFLVCVGVLHVCHPVKGVHPRVITTPYSRTNAAAFTADNKLRAAEPWCARGRLTPFAMTI